MSNNDEFQKYNAEWKSNPTITDGVKYVIRLSEKAWEELRILTKKEHKKGKRNFNKRYFDLVRFLSNEVYRMYRQKKVNKKFLKSLGKGNPPKVLMDMYSDKFDEYEFTKWKKGDSWGSTLDNTIREQIAQKALQVIGGYIGRFEEQCDEEEVAVVTYTRQKKKKKEARSLSESAPAISNRTLNFRRGTVSDLTPGSTRGTLRLHIGKKQVFDCPYLVPERYWDRLPYIEKKAGFGGNMKIVGYRLVELTVQVTTPIKWVYTPRGVVPTDWNRTLKYHGHYGLWLFGQNKMVIETISGEGKMGRAIDRIDEINTAIEESNNKSKQIKLDRKAAKTKEARGELLGAGKKERRRRSKLHKQRKAAHRRLRELCYDAAYTIWKKGSDMELLFCIDSVHPGTRTFGQQYMEEALLSLCQEHGSPYVVVRPSYGTQRCSRCGRRNKRPKNDSFVCAYCPHTDITHNNSLYNCGEFGRRTWEDGYYAFIDWLDEKMNPRLYQKRVSDRNERKRLKREKDAAKEEANRRDEELESIIRETKKVLKKTRCHAEQELLTLRITEAQAELAIRKEARSEARQQTRMENRKKLFVAA